VNQRMKAPQDLNTSSNLTDLGWVAAHIHVVMRGELFDGSMLPVRRPR
jgi:hypothetical protein